MKPKKDDSFELLISIEGHVLRMVRYPLKAGFDLHIELFDESGHHEVTVDVDDVKRIRTWLGTK